jgi:hypothetical protein
MSDDPENAANQPNRANRRIDGVDTIIVIAVVILTLFVFFFASTTHNNYADSRRYRSASGLTKTAVVQAIAYANDKGVYPTRLRVLRDAGYASVLDIDSWGNPWVLSPVLIQGAKPKPDDHVWICSRGKKDTGLCGWSPLEGPPPQTEDGSVGYSTIYGLWQGE